MTYVVNTLWEFSGCSSEKADIVTTYNIIYVICFSNHYYVLANHDPVSHYRIPWLYAAVQKLGTDNSSDCKSSVIFRKPLRHLRYYYQLIMVEIWAAHCKRFHHFCSQCLHLNRKTDVQDHFAVYLSLFHIKVGISHEDNK